LLLKPLDGLADGGPDALGRRGSAEPILFGGDHVDDLTATDYEGFEFLSLGITQRTKRRANFVGEEGKDGGVDGVSLSELAGGLGKVADLARIDRHDGEGRACQRCDGSAFETAGC